MWEHKGYGYGIYYSNKEHVKYECLGKEHKQDSKWVEFWSNRDSYEGEYKQGKKCVRVNWNILLGRYMRDSLLIKK